jgi:hypothetical protein
VQWPWTVEFTWCLDGAISGIASASQIPFHFLVFGYCLSAWLQPGFTGISCTLATSWCTSELTHALPVSAQYPVGKQRQSETCTTLDWPDTGMAWWAADVAWSACGRVERAAVWQRCPPPAELCIYRWQFLYTIRPVVAVGPGVAIQMLHDIHAYRQWGAGSR